MLIKEHSTIHFRVLNTVGTASRIVWQKLSRHIRKASPASSSTVANSISESRIGISIEPSQVRLTPGPVDLYRWKVLPVKRQLFSKNLSDHSIGAYKELYRGVGISFEAISITATQTKTGSEDIVQDVLSLAEVYKHLEFQSLLTNYLASTSQLQCEKR
jgi:hypothetical protein